MAKRPGGGHTAEHSPDEGSRSASVMLDPKSRRVPPNVVRKSHRT
jgi:hypothetical protein